MGFSPVSGRNPVNALEGAREMQLVGISDGVSDLVDGIVRKTKKLRGCDHPVVDPELLRSLAYRFPEDLAEIAPVQA